MRTHSAEFHHYSYWFHTENNLSSCPPPHKKRVKNVDDLQIKVEELPFWHKVIRRHAEAVTQRRICAPEITFTQSTQNKAPVIESFKSYRATHLNLSLATLHRAPKAKKLNPNPNENPNPKLSGRRGLLRGLHFRKPLKASSSTKEVTQTHIPCPCSWAFFIRAWASWTMKHFKANK